jgi:hypothetical protein
MKDYFGILGLTADATEADIKRAYRRLAREWHPDVNPSPDATARFVEINEAYELLSDEELRRAYSWKTSNSRADFEEQIRREAIFRMWMRDRQADSRSRAYQYANASFDEFENSPIYRTAMVVSRVYNYIFLAIGAVIIVLPILSYLLQSPDLPDSEKTHASDLMFPMCVGSAFLYGIYYFLFKYNQDN